MAENIVSLANHLAAKREQMARGAFGATEEDDRFLFDEGLDLLASYRAIPDRETRRGVRDLIVLVAERPEILSQLAPASPDPSAVPIAAPAPPEAAFRGRTLMQKGRAAAVFLAMLLAASFVLEVADPATTDVVAASAACAPAATLSP